MNRFLEFISHGPHQIQRTFFSDLEHEAGPVPETLVAHLYPKTVHSQKSTEALFRKRSNVFAAKTFLKIPTTTLQLVECLQSDHYLRLIYGFETHA
jgi:hypothetical protein